MLSTFDSRLSAKVSPTPTTEKDNSASPITEKHDPDNTFIAPLATTLIPAASPVLPNLQGPVVLAINEHLSESPNEEAHTQFDVEENSAEQRSTELRALPPRPIRLPALAWIDQESRQNDPDELRTRLDPSVEVTETISQSQTTQACMQTEESPHAEHTGKTDGDSLPRKKVDFCFSSAQLPPSLQQTSSSQTPGDAVFTRLMYTAHRTSSCADDISEHDHQIGKELQEKREKKDWKFSIEIEIFAALFGMLSLCSFIISSSLF